MINNPKIVFIFTINRSLQELGSQISTLKNNSYVKTEIVKHWYSIQDLTNSLRQTLNSPSN